ncbi:MAG TPA: TIGR03618 family F420-dependent PPOX class oxidoreductase [Acidimicrobiia bacterium]|nr:TIGR03618 family F420-dependent PPOX class oxidoreductase [Acidimicrobiia bacterium]
MARSPATLTSEELTFLTERHIGSLTTIRPDGSPHVVAISFMFDPTDGVVRIITGDVSRKVHNIEATGRAAVCQVDGRRWLTLEGQAIVTRDVGRIAAAVSAFEARYRTPGPNPKRVAIEITIERVMGRS